MKITPHLWFDTQAVEATKLYTSLFKDSHISSVSSIKDTPSGECDIVSFTLAGLDFMAISAGPIFKFNPSISLFTVFDTEEELIKVWDALIDGGSILMPLNSYPWASKYGWLSDKYGLSWQLSLNDKHSYNQKITPLLMFTQGKAGLAKEAIEKYTHIFPDSKIDLVSHYEKGEGDKEEYIKHAQFTLAGGHFMAMDSSANHKFVFNEAISFIVHCETQKEIDFYWSELSAVPEAEQCGWLKDKYGVSWQIAPTLMNELMSKGTPEQSSRVTQAFLKMKKFDIAALRRAYDGE
jgi:predicted 3-demethylubiquinone-9 3-methyltransferase (glyoxalase superfamily)